MKSTKQQNLKQFKKQVIQLFKAMLYFQKEVQKKKLLLFSDYRITPQYIWYSITSAYPNLQFKQGNTRQNQKKLLFIKNKQKIPLNPKSIALFLYKHNYPILKKQLKALIYSFSSFKNFTLNQDDLWQIFVPRTQKFVDDIVDSRIKSKYNAIVRCEESHYKLKDLMIEILLKTIDFQNVLHQMKKNVMIQNYKQFDIGVINAKNLQLFIAQFAPQIRIYDAQILLKSIYKNKGKIGIQKIFYQFLIPYIQINQQKKYINPIQNFKEQNSDEEVRLHLANIHKKVSKFGNIGDKNKSKMYLGMKHKHIT